MCEFVMCLFWDRKGQEIGAAKLCNTPTRSFINTRQHTVGSGTQAPWTPFIPLKVEVSSEVSWSHGELQHSLYPPQHCCPLTASVCVYLCAVQRLRARPVEASYQSVGSLKVCVCETPHILKNCIGQYSRFTKGEHRYFSTQAIFSGLADSENSQNTPLFFFFSFENHPLVW